MKLEADGLKAAQELFKSLNLPQESAQRLVDFYAKQVGDALKAGDTAADEMVNGWMDQAKADPELAGKLPKVKENLGKMYDVLINAVPEKAAEARQLIADFKQAMNLTGAGSHPAFIKVLNRLAERIIEPAHVSGRGPVITDKDGRPQGNPGLAASMYPTKS